jgi:hypothetical protein
MIFAVPITFDDELLKIVNHKGNWKRRAVAFVIDSFFIGGGHREKLLVPRNT